MKESSYDINRLQYNTIQHIPFFPPFTLSADIKSTFLGDILSLLLARRLCLPCVFVFPPFSSFFSVILLRVLLFLIHVYLLCFRVEIDIFLSSTHPRSIATTNSSIMVFTSSFTTSFSNIYIYPRRRVCLVSLVHYNNRTIIRILSHSQSYILYYSSLFFFSSHCLCLIYLLL